MKLDLTFIILSILLILTLIYFPIFQFQNNPKEIITRQIDTIRVTDTVILKVNKFIKVKAKIDTTIKVEIKNIIQLEKDSLEKLLRYVIAPVDTLISFNDSAKLKIKYIPIKRNLFIDSEFPKIFEKTIIKDSIYLEVEKTNLKEIFIFSTISILAGLVIGLLIN